MEEVPETIAEPPPSSLALVVSAFFEPGELSTRELGGRSRTACQEELQDHHGGSFFLFSLGRGRWEPSAQRPLPEGEK